MCYSAQVRSDYRDYVKMFGAHLGIKEFVDLFLRRQEAKLTIPKGVVASFERGGDTPGEKQIAQLIETYKADRTMALETEIFAQRKRLADAERTLLTKQTKKATEDKRIATAKVSKFLHDLEDLRRTEPKDRDSRIFPGSYAPVMVVRDGQKVILPMRYHCRPIGTPAFFDRKYPGTYNARRDSLGGYWKKLFGYTHGLIVASAFYENVKRHNYERRELAPGEEEQNIVLEFKPQSRREMLIPCLWSHWTGHGEPDLLSFAAITDEPPPEVSAAGHDRCILDIKPEHVDAWLNPDPKNLGALQAIFDDRIVSNVYENRLTEQLAA